jgi:preprotein translocase subunit SecE
VADPAPTAGFPAARREVFDVSAPDDGWHGIVRSLEEIRQELGRVTWPRRREVRAYTIVVVVAVVVVMTFVFALDQTFNRLVIWLFGH